MISTSHQNSNGNQQTPSTAVQNQAAAASAARQGTGVVTKILDNFGFIDDTIFFPLSVVRGSVNVGDKVYFECTYAKNLPFNWNATIVQPLSSPSSGAAAVAPPNPNPTAVPQNLQQQATAPPMLRQPPMHQQQQQQPQQPASSYQQHQQSGNMYGGHHHQPQSGQQQPPPGGYYQPPPQQQRPPPPPGGGQPPPYNSMPPSSYQSGGSGPPPPPSMMQPGGGRMAPPPPSAYGANNSDLVKVQQAVAAAAQLAQYYSASNPNPNQQQQGPPPGRNQQQDHHHHPGGPPPQPPSNQYGGPAAGQAGPGPIQYTSTPGSVFLGSPFGPPANQQGGPPPQSKPPGLNQQIGGGVGGGQGPPWEHPGDRGGRPSDPRDRNRFSKPSRFSDPEPPPPPQQQQRFSGPPPNNEDRFGPPQHPGGFGPPPQHDHFRGADMRREEPAPQQKFGMRDKDNRQERENQNNRAAEREKERVERRERERREREREREQARSSKRSISPSPSVGSSTGPSTGSKSSGLDFLPKRRLDTCNIPKTSIVKNRYSALELKTRVGNAIHIPSDLKEVLYNVEADFDLFDIPKPITYKIINEKDSKEKDSPPSKKSEEKDKKPDSKTVETDEKNKKSSEEDKKESSKPEGNAPEKTPVEEVAVVKKETENQTISEPKEEKKDNAAPAITSKDAIETEEDDTMMSQNTNADTSTDVANTSGKESSSRHPKQASHKYNVKVLLVSLPPLAEIYERLFGMEFAGTSSYSPGSGAVAPGSGKNQVSHFHKLFSLLVTRNSNDGYSLIGGKYAKDMDGYLPGTMNEPNLVATAIRVVWEQTKLNLSTCKQWRVLSTFVYNRDNNLIPNQCGYEITKIYMPDIWSALDGIYQPLKTVVESPAVVSEKPVVKNELSVSDNGALVLELNEPPKLEIEMTDDNAVSDLVSGSESRVNETVVPPTTNDNQEGNSKEEQIFISGVPNVEKKIYLEKVLENMANYKVSDLKNELDKLGGKYESRSKKEQLFQLLHEMVQKSLHILNGGDGSSDDLTISKDNDMEDPGIAASDVPMDQLAAPAADKEEERPEEASSSGKRKLDSDSSPALAATTDESAGSEVKKPKLEEPLKPAVEEGASKRDEKPPEDAAKAGATMAATGSGIKVRGAKMTVVTLHAGLNPHRMDQFEFSIVSELLRDSLTIHFARYIYSAIVHNIRLQRPIVPAGQDRPRTTPVNYVHLAFSYFDRGHCGYMYSDDLNQLLQMTGMPVSRKTFAALIQSVMTLAGVSINSSSSSSSLSNERLVYIFFEQPAELISRQVDYPTIGSSRAAGTHDTPQLMVERNGIQYNVDELIKQSEADQKIKVQTNDALVNATNRIVQLDQLVAELEVKQRKMSAATGRQNDELCAVKRERDQLKSKFEQLKRFWNRSINDFHGLMKTLDPPPPPAPIQQGGSTNAAATETSNTNGQKPQPPSSSS